MTRRIPPAPLRGSALSSPGAVAAKAAARQPGAGIVGARCDRVVMPGVTLVAVAGLLIVAALLVICWLPRGGSFDRSG